MKKHLGPQKTRGCINLVVVDRSFFPFALHLSQGDVTDKDSRTFAETQWLSCDF